MARGMNLRTGLRLPGTWDQARQQLERWGSSLPLGAVGFHVTRSSNAAAVPAATNARIAFTVVLDDAETWWPAGGGSVTELVVPRALSGLYHLEGLVALSASTAAWHVAITVNDVAIATSSSATVSRHPVAGLTPLAEGDRLSLMFANLTGGALTPVFAAATDNTARTPFFRGYRVSLL